jgi:hypothetical protein
MLGHHTAAQSVNQTEMSTLPECGIGGPTMPRARSMEASRRALDRCRNVRLYLRSSTTASGRVDVPHDAEPGVRPEHDRRLVRTGVLDVDRPRCPNLIRHAADVLVSLEDQLAS